MILIKSSVPLILINLLYSLSLLASPFISLVSFCLPFSPSLPFPHQRLSLTCLHLQQTSSSSLSNFFSFFYPLCIWILLFFLPHFSSLSITSSLSLYLFSIRFRINLISKFKTCHIHISFSILYLYSKINRDASGQGRFSTIIRSYSRGAQGILLVYDITNKWSFSGLKRWLREVEEVNQIL